ncbi:MAG TPA: DNA-3-methyladenine glycosylase 2 family protein, partial [Rhodanobacteraceae bacterium]|nr:DNA-3-methyladenine glycosylase 2 family protein [Rhodanobacteraceae bacterium]
VEMLLMFRLGRADVLPVDDLGVRKGAQIVHGFEEMPPPRMLREFGERWAPYRTLAAFYLWRVVDAANPPKPGAKPVKRSQS